MSAEQQFNKFIQEHKNILIVPAQDKKLDTLPVALAISYILTDLGKNTTIYFSKSIPDGLDFLELSRAISSSLHQNNMCAVIVDTNSSPLKQIQYIQEKNIVKITFKGKDNAIIKKEDIRFEGGISKWDAIITVGTNNIEDLKEENKTNTLSLEGTPLAVINNNPYYEKTAGVSITNTEASSCSEIVTRLFKEIDEGLLTPRVATSLLAGLLASTQNLQKENIKPQSLFTAAYLISKKANKGKIIRHLYKTKPLEFIKLWGYVLAKFSYDEESKIGWSTVEDLDFKKSGSPRSSVTMLVGELRNNFAQADLFILGIEKTNGEKIALLHSVKPKNINFYSEYFGVDAKNSSILVPLSPIYDLKGATEIFIKQVKSIS